jgi:hypothetical protein
MRLSPVHHRFERAVYTYLIMFCLPYLRVEDDEHRDLIETLCPPFCTSFYLKFY